jgi:polysaccharide biosynthesis transport protein
VVNPGMSLEPRGETINLLTQFKTVLEYKWQIVGVAIIAIAVTALAVFSITPIYRATNSIAIEYRQNNVLGVADVYETGAGANSYYATQLAVLRSRDMAEKAVTRIEWERYPDFLKSAPSIFETIKSRITDEFPELAPIFGADKSAVVELTGVALLQARINAFVAATQVEPVINTQVVKVHFLAKNPVLAMESANALAEAYIESGFEAQFEAARRATEWLNERLSGVKGRLAESESALQEFREQQNILNIGSGKSVLEAELTDNMQRLRDAERAKNQLQNTYAQIRQAGDLPYLLQQISVLVEDELVRSTKQGFLVAEQEVSQLTPRYGPKHPAMIKAQARLMEAREAFQQQLRRAAQGIRSKYQIAEKNVRSLSEAVEKTRQQIRALDRQDYSMQVLAREADANSQLYDTILKRFKEADLSGDFQTLKARVIDPAILPARPHLPNKRRALMFAAFFGALGGIGLALVRNHLDASIKTGDDLEQISGKPVFASVPEAGRRLLGGSVAKMVEDKPRSAFSEGIRTIRTGVLLSDLDKNKRRILVTSALPQEGKSSVATNLALAFAQMEKVLLVDCDLRKPNLAKYMGLKGSPVGISDMLRGDVDRKNLAVHQVAPNVDLLPVGKHLPSPGQVLTSDRFRQLLDEVSEGYDRVIIDSAPCNPVSDTLLLASHVDGVVFVVRYDSTNIKVVQTVLKKIAKSQTPVLGMVLNRVDHKRAMQSGDSYYYGDGYYS